MVGGLNLEDSGQIPRFALWCVWQEEEDDRKYEDKEELLWPWSSACLVVCYYCYDFENDGDDDQNDDDCDDDDDDDCCLSVCQCQALLARKDCRQSFGSRYKDSRRALEGF